MYVIMCEFYQFCGRKDVTEWNIRKVTCVCTSDILRSLVAALSRDGVKFVVTPESRVHIDHQENRYGYVM